MSQLPSVTNLDYLRKQAQGLLKAFRAGNPRARVRVEACFPPRLLTSSIPKVKRRLLLAAPFSSLRASTDFQVGPH
ncbi:MAG: hypothetical protein ACR2PL_04565 [Dehalococcoidia bacterium]